MMSPLCVYALSDHEAQGDAPAHQSETFRAPLHNGQGPTGGVAADIDSQGITDILGELNYLSQEFEKLVVIIDENSSLEDRTRANRHS